MIETNNDNYAFEWDSSTHYIKWVDIQDNIKTGTASGTLQLDGDCGFDGLDIQTGYTLDLNGYKGSFSGTLTTTGTLTSGTTSEVELLSGATYTSNQAMTLKALYVNGTAEIQENLTFTASEAFSNSSGEIYINGTAGDLIYVSGPNDWIINASSLVDYWFWYVNVTEGQNIGTKTIVALGEGYNLTGSWDFDAPIIPLHHGRIRPGSSAEHHPHLRLDRYRYVVSSFLELHRVLHR